LHEFSEDSELKAVRTEYRAVVAVKEFGTNIIVVAEENITRAKKK